MERRHFLHAAGVVAALSGLPRPAAAAPAIGSEEPLAPFLLPPLPPLAHGGGMDLRVWVRSAQTGGVYSCVECAVAPKVMGPPPHHHLALDELMYVLEGTAHVLVGDDIVEVPAGGWHFRPRLLRHTFWNASDAPLRFIDMYFNQPFELFLERLFRDLTPENGFPEGSEALRRERDRLNEEYGLVYAPTSFAERQALVAQYGLR